jgi:HEPN domain-containing protein
MNYEARDYYRAALERIKQTRDLYRKERQVNHHSLAFYAAGLAVECMLRAFVTLKSKEFESRHDLEALFQESGILGMNHQDPGLAKLPEVRLESIKKELGAAVSRVNRLWRNSLRFSSETHVKSHLHELGADRGIKGDVLKENLRRLIGSCDIIIQRGTVLWESSQSLPKK